MKPHLLENTALFLNYETYKWLTSLENANMILHKTLGGFVKVYA